MSEKRAQQFFFLKTEMDFHEQNCQNMQFLSFDLIKKEFSKTVFQRFQWIIDDMKKLKSATLFQAQFFLTIK